MTPEVVRLASALTEPASRAGAARALARALGAETLIVFVRDPEVDALLPAPGFPRTLPDGRRWRAFLEATIAGGRHAGELPLTAAAERLPSVGLAAGTDVVGVLVGASTPGEEVESFRLLLPLLAAAFRGEQAAATANVQAGLARSAAAQERAVAAALETARSQLQAALLEAERVRRDLQAVNGRLRDQTTELEAQAEALRRTNTSLEEARVAADAANRAKSEFLAMMSHELRTPLNAIGGHVQLMEIGIHGPLTDAQRESLGRIERSQRHLLGLINDILNLARIEAGRVDYAITSVRLGDVMADLRAMIEPQLAARDLSFTVALGDPAVRVRADREKLEQILLNLLSNAVKFTDPGGQVAITAERPGDDIVQVRVSDTGRGIPADKLQSIFEPFVQVDASHTRPGEGTGLGLAISRDLARGMGGELTVASVLGAGSTFTLTLPADRAAPLATDEPQLETSAASEV